MKNASKIMYKIGKILAIIQIVCSVLLIVFASVGLGDVARIAEEIRKTSPITDQEVYNILVVLIVGCSAEIVIDAVVVCLIGKALKSLEAKPLKNTMHIVLIVIGAFFGLFVLLGGIFGLVYNAQESGKAIAQAQDITKPQAEDKTDESKNNNA